MQHVLENKGDNYNQTDKQTRCKQQGTFKKIHGETFMVALEVLCPDLKHTGRTGGDGCGWLSSKQRLIHKIIITQKMKKKIFHIISCLLWFHCVPHMNIMIYC